ncbi:hypothetical protein [Paenibacillus alkalitolerans]|uniref:hypothetical protein n=1 Tax=Paenibacillus alkalitolerans TaxID=2799335 RepID=UPI0018F4E881|nr:hypothetical protein [Paenibacillus alkalitolerans]
MSATSAAEKVIYQYTLVKKVRPKPFWLISHGSCLLLFGIVSGAFVPSLNWVVPIAAVLLYMAIEFIVVCALSWSRPEWSVYSSRYRWTGSFPWIGYFPVQAVPLRYFRISSIHTMWIGCSAAGLYFAWLHDSGALYAAFAVLWTAVPRVWIIAAFRTGSRDEFLIRFQDKEFSLYVS